MAMYTKATGRQINDTEWENYGFVMASQSKETGIWTSSAENVLSGMRMVQVKSASSQTMNCDLLRVVVPQLRCENNLAK